MRKLGVNRQKLIGIGATLREQVQKISAQVSGTVVPGYHTANNLDTWMNLTPLHRSPLPWGMAPPAHDPNDPHRWSLFQPPFWSFPGSFVRVEGGGFRVNATQFSHPAVGHVGHNVIMELADADSTDVASADIDTRLGLMFEAVADGPLEIVIDAQNVRGTHDLKTRNEFGWSGTWTHQTNYLTAQVLHPDVPDRSLAAMSYFQNDDVETHAEETNLITGHHYFMHVLTTGTVLAGQSVAILVGTRNWETCFCDDVGYESETNFQWDIRSVEVRTRA